MDDTNDGVARPAPHRTAVQPQVMWSRRQFLVGISTLAAGSLLTACGQEENVTYRPEAEWDRTFRPRILPNPQTLGPPTPLPTPLPGQLGLDQFLELSAVLTGFEDLSPVLGMVYLESLQQAGGPGLSVAQLYEQAGFTSEAPPRSIDALDRAGVFDDQQMRTLADTIIEYWYTGIYGAGDTQKVATYVDALAWEAVTFAKPRSICGPYPGFWREMPPYIP